MNELVIRKILVLLIFITLVMIEQTVIFGQFININITNTLGLNEYQPSVAISHTNPDNAVMSFYPNARYVYTLNGGKTWSAPTFIDSVLNPTLSQICVDNSGNFFVSCLKDSIRIYKSTNQGRSFFPLAWIPGSQYSINTRPQAMACDLSSSSPYRNNIYVSWYQYLSRSTDGGITWSQPVSTSLNMLYGPSIAICPNGQINLVCMSGSNDNYYYNRSTDGGLSFAQSSLLFYVGFTPLGFNASYPSIACDRSGGQYNGNLYVLFCDFALGEGYCVVSLRSRDNGITWDAPVRVTDDAINVVHRKPWVTVNSDGEVIICYYDSRNSPPPGPSYYWECESWLARSTNGGSNYSNEKMSSSLMPRDALNTGYYTGIDAWGGRIIPAWTDKRDTLSGQTEIYSAIVGSFSVGGHVTFADNGQPVDSGHVKALYYDYTQSQLITIDSTKILTGGLYTLPHVTHDTVFIMFYQNDDYLQFVPTYYQSSINWQQAVKLIVSQNLTNINGQVIRINNTGGSYSISGNATANSSGDLTTAPLKDAIIYVQSGSAYKNYGISNSSGAYIAHKLLPGSYNLVAQRMGYNPVSQNVTITNSNLTNINFNFGSPIGVEQISAEVPKSFSLKQNYPNPFNPETVIKFELPKAGNVKVSVYEINGRLVNVLVDENLNAGTYSVKWDGSLYASGVYFYRVETKDFAETKKMLLIK